MISVDVSGKIRPFVFSLLFSTVMALLEFRCAPIPQVRIALIGLGERGLKTLERYRYIDGATFCCLADRDADKLTAANEELVRTGRPAADTFRGEEAWQEICRRPGIDLVYICTDWQSHADIAVEAMRCGKHVAVEVPAATTVEDCWRLVDTAEQTRRHCFMTENCCYDLFALGTLALKRAGLFGNITHCEGAYIHSLAESFRRKGEAYWMHRACARHFGNPYPTHGMGPIGWLLDLHRGDRMDYLVSLTPQPQEGNDGSGSVNTTLIRTVRGVSILQQFDITTPRPYSRLQTVCGTQGYAQKYPLPTLQTADSAVPLTGAAAEAAVGRLLHDHPAAQCWQEGHARGVPNEMNFAMDRRLIHCLRRGLPLDIDVYDAAEWSCLAELSEQSARNGSAPVPIPDFTRGRWNELQGHRFFR